MCGIAGAFAFGPDAGPIDQSVIVRLNDLQRHRGPDGQGLWASADKRIVLGNRRLAIIETTASGAQPMTDATGRWMISFNGEIYNYRALRTELEKLGYVFRTKSDTEVLINVISHWGESGIKKLRGMYAFALWDSLRQELWLARDPYGIKPLYVSESRGTVWFASQARALANCAPVDVHREAAALAGFYLWGHIPEPFSWWAGIRMLPAGHVQRIRTGKIMSAPVSITTIVNAFTKRPPQSLRPGELHEAVFDSVRNHMVADVPVGVFLSSGIDSNIIAALAAELGGKLKTVTLAFDEYSGSSDDEAPLAEVAARALCTDHVTVRIGREEFELLLEDFLKSMDQPTIDGLNTYLISRAAATQGLKVVLSGLGGDELFAGYPSFHQIPRFLKWGAEFHISNAFGCSIENLLRAVVPLVGLPPKTVGLLSHSGDVAHAYLLRRALHLEGELDAFLDESWLKQGLERLSTIDTINQTIDPLRMANSSVYAQIAALEACWYMRNQLLRDTDWSSMTHGVEVRVPFVDMALLEWLAPAIASDNPPGKQDLAACAEIPHAIRAHPKTGFTTPLKSWIEATEGSSVGGSRRWAARVHRFYRNAMPYDDPLSEVAA